MTLCKAGTRIAEMKNHDLMRDPFFAQLMYVIESAICMADKHAKESGVRLTDSSIKSALNKARRITPNQIITPLTKLESRDDFVEELARSIAANREIFVEETEYGGEKQEISPSDWINAISAVEASLKLRRSTEPGTRYYLDYVRNFIGEGKV